ncbi:MAG: ABC transporter ATP-binding protein [Butyrivibrio sp.]|jgi:ATP-binding cassette subfamily B protein|uniref:ABC transporter ATP-binding protein n=1 Tax=Butyrivibrio sp. TaxID=28121 RepID=UPI001EBAC063|nr:ABC transporter ATP-binding protein [Butyrivibrio sp.]MBE5840347.1 ABC transporter ATP-binding protein [Butyrivibrio sp.]
MFKKVLEYTGEYKKYTFAAMLLLVIGLSFNVVQFIAVYKMINGAINGEKSLGYYGYWALVMLVCGLMYVCFYIWGLIKSHFSAYQTLKNLRISLQGKMENLPLGVIQEIGVGSLKKVYIDDIDNLELLLAHALPEGFSNLCVPIIVIVTMFFIDWKLALLSLASLPIGMIAMMAMYSAGTSKMGDYYTAAQKMNDTIVEYVNGMEVVKIFGRDGDSYRRFSTDVISYRDFTLAWYKMCWPWMALYGSFLPCVALLTLPIGGYFVYTGSSSLSNFLLVLCMAFSIGPTILRALTFMSVLPQLNYKITALENILSAAPLKQGEKSFEGKDHSIEFKNVNFSYDGKVEVIEDANLKIPENKVTALVGESGSGKSTLAKLLVHFYDVSEGSVKIGGQDITDMSLEALNNEISFVSQEQFLFNMSIMDNIRLGKLDATDEEVIEAAKKAQCQDFLDKLDKGIYSSAGGAGKKLSGGERQRIALARAILKNAPIIVLDEATAFMDPENEEKMNRAIAELISDKTVIVIAHRLYSIKNADKIVVMKNGKIHAEGTHEELLRDSEIYKNLWELSEGTKEWSVTAKEVMA